MKSLLLATLFIGSLFVVSGCCTTRTAGRGKSGLVILKAVYGVGMTNTVDVTDEIRSLAKSGSIHLHPQWALGIDPAFGKTKRLTVAYRYMGRIGIASFNEFEEVDIPLAPDY